ncbi:uncharacterized protein [Diadema antillarum]|uniref:uncharacterized protein n=1 Tax=Diadema antillarum TaxID=105358 RepID=UPI003A840983
MPLVMESLASSSSVTEEEIRMPSLAQAMADDTLMGLECAEGIQKYLASHTDEGGIDATADDGRTALMIACEKGQEDIVRFLLKMGANPHFSSPKSGDTPLHASCKRPTGFIPFSTDTAKENKIKIVQTLLQHGVISRDNRAGLTPLHVAALSGFGSLGEFLMSPQCNDSGISEPDKITYLEMLGFSQYMAGGLCEAYETLCKVISQRCHFPERRADPELEAIIQCTEKYSLADINAIKGDMRAMKVQWLLIGDRIIPEGAKGEYFFKHLARFACQCMQQDDASRGYNIFKYLLSCESHSKAVLGTVMDGIYPFFGPNDNLDTKVVTQGCEIVNEYRDVIRHVSNSSLVEHSPELIKIFGRLLFDFAYFFSELDLLESLIKTAEKVMTVVRAACSSLDKGKYKSGSVTFEIMDKLFSAFRKNMFRGTSLNRVKRVMCKLLWYDDLTYKEQNYDSIFHRYVLTLSTKPERDQSFLVDLAKIMVRHGCPVNMESDFDGETPGEMFTYLMECGIFDENPNNEDFKVLSDLLCPTTSMLSLKEIASRVVLQNKIPYHGVLPKGICKMMTGETLTPDPSILKTPEESESESE